MKHNFLKRAVSLLLTLVCVVGVLPLSVFAAEGLSSAPGSITQRSSDYMKIAGRSVRYRAASSTINNVGLPYVFNEQVDVPGLGPTRALCAYQKGTLGPGANGQKWNFKEEVNSASLQVLLTYIYSHTYGDFSDAGNAIGLDHWDQYWSDIWFLVAQAMSWYYEHGIIKDVNSDREGFIEQAAEEFVAAMRLYHDTYGQSSFITDWSKIGTHSVIDSSDGGKTGNSAYDFIATGVNIVLDHPEYYHNYHLWIYEWDKSQPWKLEGQSGVPMQRLLIAVPDEQQEDTTVRLTVKKLEAGANKPIPGVTFKVEGMNGDSSFSATRETGADGTFTLTAEADNLTAGQYKITEEAAPEGYSAQTTSQIVTVMPNGSANSVFVFYNEPNKKEGDGSIRKVDSDNPTVGIAGAVIRITSVKLDGGGAFTGEYITGDGGYISNEDLDFSKLPTGSYVAEEITPPEGYVLSSDMSKVKQTFVWDGEHDISLVFENSSKVKVQLKKVDEGSNPLPGAIFVILRDGQVIGTEETQADGTITVSNVTEGYYEFREVHAPEGFDKDSSPVGVHVTHEDIQGEQTIVVTKMNHHKRTLTIQKRDAETSDPIPGTSFHIRGVNLGYENDVVTSADGKAVLESMPSGCYEIEEVDVPKPYILDSNNRKTVWIDAEKDKDVVVDFVNSTLPGVRLMKRDRQTNKPLPGVTFKIEEVDGGFTDQRQTDKDGMIFWENLRPGAYKVYEVEPAPNYVHDDTVHVVQLEPNHTTTIELTNILKPTLKVLKVDSVTHSPIANVKFQIWRGSDDTITGELNDLGVFQTNASGEIVLEHIDTGWYRIKELEPAGWVDSGEMISTDLAYTFVVERSMNLTADFGEIKCDFYGDGKDFWMTRSQVGTALEYSNPVTAIKNLHKRYKARLDNFSRVAQIEPPSGGGLQDTTIYNRKGIMEICRHSDQPKADAFMDFCWEIMDGLMSGRAKIVGMTEYQQQNIHIQKAKLLNQIASEYDGTYKQVLQAYATKELAGEFLLPLPKLERKTYSAAEIGAELGISAHKVGTLANSNGLKTDEYGKWFADKSAHSSKEVQSFRYYDCVIPVLRDLI